MQGFVNVLFDRAIFYVNLPNGTAKDTKMTESSTPLPSQEEIIQLKRDAAHNVADAHDSLHGNLEALARWRTQYETQVSTD